MAIAIHWPCHGYSASTAQTTARSWDEEDIRCTSGLLRSRRVTSRTSASEVRSRSTRKIVSNGEMSHDMRANSLNWRSLISWQTLFNAWMRSWVTTQRLMTFSKSLSKQSFMHVECQLHRVPATSTQRSHRNRSNVRWWKSGCTTWPSVPLQRPQGTGACFVASCILFRSAFQTAEKKMAENVSDRSATRRSQRRQKI